MEQRQWIKDKKKKKSITSSILKKSVLLMFKHNKIISVCKSQV